MPNINPWRPRTQTISNDEIRLSIIRKSGEMRGGLKKMAELAGMSYDALWGQLNRNAGVLGETIVKITVGLRDPFLLREIAASCGYLCFPMVKGNDSKKSIRKAEVSLSIGNGEILKKIERALADDVITKAEADEIYLTFIRQMSNEAELAFRIKREAKP